MQKAWANKGFTIIELIVSIVVIGILVTIMVVSYSGIQQRSRDSERGSDVVKLKIAIEKYHADKGSYPQGCGDDVGCAISNLSADLQPYLSTLPQDPRYAGDANFDYQYVRGPAVDDSYAIRVRYESKIACKTGQNINMNWWATWAGGTPIC